MIGRAAVVILIFIFDQECFALDPAKSIHQYVHDVWQIQQGLPQSSVGAIIQTHDGYLWLGTEEGLARFDGVRFRAFDQSNTPEIKSNWIRNLYEDREKALWIATIGGGLSRWKNGNWSTFTTDDGLSNNSVNEIIQDRQGDVWAATENGLNRLRNNKWTVYTVSDGLSSNMVRALHEDRNGRLWVGTDRGLNVKQDDEQTFSSDDVLSKVSVRYIMEDSKRCIWVGTLNGLNSLCDGKWSHYTTRDDLANDSVWVIKEDRDGSLWIGTNAGLNRFRNGKWNVHTTKEGLSNNEVRSIYEDREGSLWIGTNGGGLNRFADGKFTAITVLDGLSNNIVRSILQDDQGVLWFGTNGGGLNRWADGDVTVYSKKDGLSNDMVWPLLQDNDGSLWVGTPSAGVNHFVNGKFTTYKTKDGLISDEVRSLLRDLHGNLWIGTRTGLSLFADGKFKTFDGQQELAKYDVRPLLQDKQGNIWIGTLGGGLNRIANGKLKTYTTKDGLASNHVKSLFQDQEGNLWIGNRNGGLNRYANGKFTTYTTRDGLFDFNIHTFLEDDKNLWMSCNKGIFRVSKNELKDFADGKVKVITSVAYDTADGLKTRECNGGTQPAAWKTKDGRLWFATIEGAVVIDPAKFTMNQLPPPVHIEEMIVDGVNAAPEATIQPGKENFEFRYTALSFLVPQRVKFKYKLEGFDSDWIDADTRRAAYYTHIPHGNYTFKVKASNNDGVWNEAGASFPFRLQPHYYETLWFRILGAILLGLIGYKFYSYRVNRLLESERIRTRIATDLHDDIGSGLSQIAVLSELAEEKIKENDPHSLDTLTKIASTSRELIDSMSDLVWSVNPRHDGSADLVQRMNRFASDVMIPQDIDVRFHLDGLEEERSLDPAVRRHVYLIFKEALNNILRHSTANEIDLELQINRNELLLQITDNGKGFDPGARSSGNGLKSMTQRAGVIGGTFEIVSSPGKGAKLTLRVPQ